METYEVKYQVDNDCWGLLKDQLFSPGEDTGAGVDVNGGVGEAVEQELLVDDVLP